MQMDFHHTVTYVCARMAGFEHKEADIIAYSAQYVDDATNSGTIEFDNGAKYTRISSAHKMLDYKNFDDLENRHIWVPFHFLPGNSRLQAGEDPQGGFHKKLRCTPNSYVSHDMLNACFRDKNKAYTLHRLGIAMHVYADTYAHKGFSGISHKSNKIKELVAEKINGKENNDKYETWAIKVKNFFKDKFDELTSQFVEDVNPLGHGAVLSYPDLPYLKWSYVDEQTGKKIQRDNAAEMTEAVKSLYKILYAYKYNIDLSDIETINITQEIQEDIDIIYDNFVHFDSSKPYNRHQEWLKCINENTFNTFQMENNRLSYIEKGVNSWKYKAIGEIKFEDKGDEVYPYSPTFLKSNWKLFHDALQAHRFNVIHDILPRYGICVA
jgi:hypothetical protein